MTIGRERNAIAWCKVVAALAALALFCHTSSAGAACCSPDAPEACTTGTHPEPQCREGDKITDADLSDVFDCWTTGVIFVNPFNPLTYAAALIAGGVYCNNALDRGCELLDKSGVPEIADGLDNNCDGAWLDDERCDGVDNDGDGFTDEYQGSCIMRFAILPFCWDTAAGGQADLDNEANRMWDYFMEVARLAPCFSSVYRDIRDLATFNLCPNDVNGNPLDPSAPEDYEPDLQNLLAAARTLFPGLDVDFEAIAFLTNRDVHNVADPVSGIIKNVVGASDTRSMLWTQTNGDSGVFAHEFGHMVGLNDEYCSQVAGSTDPRCPAAGVCSADDLAAGLCTDLNANPVDAAEGCDPLGGCCDDCATKNYSICCEGNRPLDIPNNWIPDHGVTGVPTGTAGRCVMSYSNAPSPRGFCRHCWAEWNLQGPKCSEVFPGIVDRLSMDMEIAESGSMTISRYEEGPGRLELGPTRETGDFVLEVYDSGGGLMQRLGVDMAVGHDAVAGASRRVWLRAPIPTWEVGLPHKIVVTENGTPTWQVTPNGSAPDADAGADQTLECDKVGGTETLLDASGSSDADGDNLSYLWSGPAAITFEPKDATQTVALPVGDTWTFSLQVSDGLYSDNDSVSYTVEDTIAPEFDVDPNLVVGGCSEGETFTFEVPVATDVCAGTLNVDGAIISKNGVPLVPPVPLQGGQVALDPGQYELEWSTHDGYNPASVIQIVDVLPGLFASNKLDIGQRSHVVLDDGGPAMLGSRGSNQTNIASAATTGSIFSYANVVVDGATVTGTVVSNGTIQKINGGQINGTPVPGSTLELPANPDLSSITFPAPGVGHTVNGGTLALDPDSYGAVYLNSGPPGQTDPALSLSTGDYYFDTLITNTDSAVFYVDDSLGPVRVFVKTAMSYRGPFIHADGTPADVFVGYAGTNELVLEAPFTGTVLAPNATLSLGTATAPEFSGQFYAKNIFVRPDVTVTCIGGDDIGDGLDPSPAGTPEHCSDGVLSGNESDTDCGGSCETGCPVGAMCNASIDCDGNLCSQGTCATAVMVNINASFTLYTDWGAGYCGAFIISNPHSDAATNWSLTFALNGTVIDNTWNGVFSGGSGLVTVTSGDPGNVTIAPGASDQSVGFCANRPAGGNALPSGVSVEAILLQ